LANGGQDKIEESAEVSFCFGSYDAIHLSADPRPVNLMLGDVLMNSDAHLVG
jgi:hypothetical protein